MADLDSKNVDQDLQHESRSFEEKYIGTEGYHEETSAELAHHYPLIKGQFVNMMVREKAAEE